jgi:HEPN domain-containing protein
VSLLFLALFEASAGLNDWAVLGACFALALAGVLFIFFIQPDASDLAPHRSKLDQLLERRDTIYDNVRDLRFEYRAGKYSEGDYEQMKTSLEMEVAQVLLEIDQVTESQTKRPRGPKTVSSAEGNR